MGDTIQFSRYAKEISKLGCKVILEVQKPLITLMEEIHGVDMLIEEGSELPQFDFHCPLMSLPLALKTTLKNIPNEIAYLKSNKEKLEEWSTRLGKKIVPRVGIVWNGNSAHKNDANRSISLQKMIEGIPKTYDLISLQTEVRKNDILTLRQATHMQHFGKKIVDFSDTAALCDLMDVIITVDTSVAHLAGALGKPVNLMLPFTPDFRWLLDRSDSPWYPTIRLFRQNEDLDWNPVFEAIRKNLTST